jgi:hypothetical protein
MCKPVEKTLTLMPENLLSRKTRFLLTLWKLSRLA